MLWLVVGIPIGIISANSPNTRFGSLVLPWLVLAALFIVMANIIVDISYAPLEPRMGHD